MSNPATEHKPTEIEHYRNVVAYWDRHADHVEAVHGPSGFAAMWRAHARKCEAHLHKLERAAAEGAK